MGAPAVPLASGIYRIPTLGHYINSYAFVDADGQVTLVDCGLKRAPRKIVKALSYVGKSPADVTRIVLTHAHLDHAGGARGMVGLTHADGVHVHAADAEYIRSGHAAPQDQSITSGRIFTRMPGGNFESTTVSAELHDGEILDVCGGLRVVHTPGHSPGHISLLHEDSGLLITGDAIFNVTSRLTWPIAALCTSYRQNQQTAQVLGDLDYSTVAFTHGPEITENARETIRAFLQRRK